MTTVFILPGWLDSGPGHWQSLWQHAHGYTRVQQHDWQHPLRGDWCARLESSVVDHLARQNTGTQALQKAELAEQYLRGFEGDCADKSAPSIVLVAHSLGCHLVAAWAGASQHTHAVRGVLLVAPPDVLQGDLPPQLHSWRHPVLQRLPFAAVCVVSTNDPFSSHSAGQAMAQAWGARCITAGALGHINGDSGLGPWPEGHALVQGLITDLPVSASQPSRSPTPH
jgi:uncharacterized protein